MGNEDKIVPVPEPNSIDAIPPREQWGTMIVEGFHYQDGQDRIFDVPFTRKELEDLRAVDFANQYLRNLSLKSGHEIEKKWVREVRPMWGYSLLDRTVGLGNIRKAATTADNLLQMREGLSRNTQETLLVIKTRLAPFSPPPATPISVK